MRSTLVVVVLVALMGLGWTPVASAQTAPRLTIHNVTLQEGTGVLTINGTGFGSRPVVTVDGWPVTVLLGGSETQLAVLAPAALLSAPGTYRLTVADPVRQTGEAFVVAVQAATVLSNAVAGQPVAAQEAAPVAASSAVISTASVPASDAGPLPLTIIEDSATPFRTAIGFNALSSNVSSGLHNTAAGYRALDANGSGHRNTAIGSLALLTNTTGFWNTASGYEALYVNSTGAGNTANGAFALLANSTGDANMASGAWALTSNTTADNNTASGNSALRNNTTGASNTANGTYALQHNTTGAFNTADGAYALAGNTTGLQNVAIGYEAGVFATTGSFNVFLGAEVSGLPSDTNTIRIGLPYSAGSGQNQTFIAGIRDTALTGSVLPVYIDANGQLGTTPPAAPPGTVIPGVPPSSHGLQDAMVQQRLAEQQAINADLLARLARVEALLVSAVGGKLR